MDLRMGVPLRPTLANIFMCHHEEALITHCPAAFAPAKYLRYIDHTLVIFKHQSIRFMYQVEQNNSLASLDVVVSRVKNKFSTSVFRKSTFSGIGISFFGYCCKKFKINPIHVSS